MDIIDVRSDTVTMPTDEMRVAMANAEVGDDVYADDPTINKLQQLAAEMVGKEAALFVPSGTMGNQLAIMVHTRRGDDVIALRKSHINVHEAGAPALLSGVTLNLIDSPDDILHADQVVAAIREDDIHCPPTTLVCTENPLAVGQAVPLEIGREMYKTAKDHGLNVHMDGARLFNAAAALGVSAKDIAATTDTVMFCLSKGLCAPVGSMLAGPAEFIERAVRGRKILGGGMRQAGVLAAAGLIGLQDMTKRIGQDNQNAEFMAQQLSLIPSVRVSRPGIQINMVFFAIDMPAHFIESLPARMLKNHNVKMNALSDGEFRFVAHNDVSKEDIEYVVASLKAELQNG